MDTEGATGRDSLLVIFVTVVSIIVFLTLVVVGLAARKSNDSAASAAPAPAGAGGDIQAVDVRLGEFSVTLARATLTPGVKTLRVANTGKVQHELLVFRSDLAPSAYPLDN